MRLSSKCALALLLVSLALGAAILGRSTTEGSELDLYTKLAEHARRGGPEAAQFMIKALGKGGWQDYDKIEALAAMGDSRALEPLCAILQWRSPLSLDAVNRAAAANALG